MGKLIADEITLVHPDLIEPPRSIYFGGGTPSLLHPKHIQHIIQQIKSHFSADCLDEITLETNPDDHNTSRLRAWKRAGVNRLSIGIQTFNDDELRWMNRSHTAQQAFQSVEMAKRLGYKNVSIDLIYGIPNQPIDEWRRNIERAIWLHPNHISAYCLTVEEKTVLKRQINSKLVSEKDDEVIEEEFSILRKLLQEAGYEHYELSNFALPGYRAIHNSSYWSGDPYVGFGPSAHSFDGGLMRQWNVNNNAEYMRCVGRGIRPVTTENLTLKQRTNEIIMTSLRTVEGLDFNSIPEMFRGDVIKSAAQLAGKWKNELMLEESRLRIDPDHWLICDSIVRELIL
ncbi:MAG: radical SAM family heme chaperone HemW [Salibacteraceae bacterium]